MFHAGDGNLHPLILYDANNPGELELAEQVVGGDRAKVLAMIRRFLAEGSSATGVLFFLGIFLLGRVDVDRGRRIAQERILASTTRAARERSFGEGRRLFDAGHYEAALGPLTDAAADPDFAEARELLDRTRQIIGGLRRQRELRAEIEGWFAPPDGQALALSVQSFSYKRGLPQDLDCAFDVRHLANPHWVEALRPLNGKDPDVVAHVTADPAFPAFYEKLTAFL